MVSVQTSARSMVTLGFGMSRSSLEVVTKGRGAGSVLPGV